MTNTSRRKHRRTLITIAALAFAAALFVIGLVGLIPFGLLIVLITEPDPGRSIAYGRRNIALAGAGLLTFAYLTLAYFNLTETVLVLLGVVLLLLPLALTESGASAQAGDAVLTKRSLVVALGAHSPFSFLYKGQGLLEGFGGVALVLPVVWLRLGCGLPGISGSNMACFVIPFGVSYGPTCSRARTSGCAGGC